jgi:hypothetical protein
VEHLTDIAAMNVFHTGRQAVQSSSYIHTVALKRKEWVEDLRNVMVSVWCLVLEPDVMMQSMVPVQFAVFHTVMVRMQSVAVGAEKILCSDSVEAELQKVMVAEIG